jgi:hypothetical protein
LINVTGLQFRSVGNSNIRERMWWWMHKVCDAGSLTWPHSKVSLGLPFTNSHNARSANLRFYIPHAGILQWVDSIPYVYWSLTSNPAQRASRIFWGCIIRQYRAKHSSWSQGSSVKRYAQLVSTFLSVQSA